MRNIIGSAKLMMALAALMAAGLLLFSACGGGDDSDKAAEEQSQGEGDGELFVDPAAPVINVALKEWGIVPSATKTDAGSVTFNVSNEGTKEHEFVVLKTDTPAEQLAWAQGKVDEDTAGEAVGEIAEFGAGKTLSKTFDLAPGHYVFICNVEGHYPSGMRADFTVG